MSIGQKIKRARQLAGLTQAELAKKSSLSRSYIGDIEKDRYNASLSALQLIADATNTTVSFLIDNEWFPPTNSYQNRPMMAHEPYAPYGSPPKKETDLDALLARGKYLTYSDKPLTEQQKQILREFVKVLIKEESNNAEAPTNSYRNGKNIRKQ